MNAENILETPWYWWLIGFGGQLIFGARFLVQWIASERAGRSVVPLVFWYLSIVGGLLMLAYACFRVDPVFILGQSVGAFIYARNLQLIAKVRRLEAEKQDRSIEMKAS